MRRSRTDLRARVNGDLTLEFGDVGLTSYAGLALFGEYLRTTGFNQIVRAACEGVRDHGDFGAAALPVVTERGWFAARPSGTENVYKVYAESFADAAHLQAIVAQAQQIVADTLTRTGTSTGT